MMHTDLPSGTETITYQVRYPGEFVMTTNTKSSKKKTRKELEQDLETYKKAYHDTQAELNKIRDDIRDKLVASEYPKYSVHIGDTAVCVWYHVNTETSDFIETSIGIFESTEKAVIRAKKLVKDKLQRKIYNRLLEKQHSGPENSK